MNPYTQNRMRRLAGSISVAAAALAATLAPLGAGSSAHANTSWVQASACVTGISIFVVEDDLSLPAPSVFFGVSGGQMREANRIGEVTGPGVPGGGKGRQFIYWSETPLPANAKGVISAYGKHNESYGSFTVNATCPALGSVRGSAFEDVNANGQREPNEATTTVGWWKLSAGGDWFICGHAGGDGTFGPTVKPSTFTLTPIAPPGWRATTAPRAVLIRQLGEASLNNDIGFVRDPRAKGDVCGQYQPQASTSALPDPIAPRATLADALAGNATGTTAFTTLLAAARATGVLDELTGGTPYTLFAPTDAAFGRVPKSTLDRLIANPKALAAVLRCHIAAQRVPAPAAGTVLRVRTLCGNTVLVQHIGNRMRVAGRAYAGAPIETQGGLIYPLDALITVRGR